MPPGPATYKLRNCSKKLLYFFPEPIFILFTNIWNFHGQNSERQLKLQNLVSQAKNIYIVFNARLSVTLRCEVVRRKRLVFCWIFFMKSIFRLLWFKALWDVDCVWHCLFFALRATGGVASCICCYTFFWCVCITDELGWLAVSEWESVCEGSISVVIIVLSFVCVVCVCESVNKS